MNFCVLNWFVTGDWDLYSFWPVCGRFFFFFFYFFFHIKMHLQAPSFTFDFSAEGFTSVPGYKNDSHPDQGRVFPSALPWTQEIQPQGTRKEWHWLLKVPPPSIPWPAPAPLCKSRMGFPRWSGPANRTRAIRHRGTFLWTSQHEI